MLRMARNATILGFGLSISAVVGWLLLRETKRQQEVAHQSRRPGAEEPQQIVLPLNALHQDTAASGTEPQKDDITRVPDDLTRIKDIGTRFAEALQATGITSFSQLAGETPESLAERLSQHVTVRAERIRTKDWIGQAALLAQK